MAQVLKFDRNSVATSLIDTSGWHILSPGWIPQVAEAEEGVFPDPVNETIDIESNFSNQDNLAAGLVSLNKVRHDARRFMKDRSERYPVWLHDQLTNETGERRALVRRISLRQLSEQHGVGSEGSMIDARPHYRLGVERGPYWERTAALVGDSDSGLSCLGGAFDYTVNMGDVVGDSPARIYSLYVTTGTNTQLEKGWLGFRSVGTLANFKSLWELEDASSNSSDTSSTGDSTASGSSMMRCDFSNETGWDWRVRILLSDVTSNYTDNYGQFVVIMRAKVTSGTAYARLRHSYGGATDCMVEGQIVEVDSTSWAMYDLGLLTIPLRDLRVIPTSVIAAAYDSNQSVDVYAKRATGSGNFDMDCLILIPANEYFIHFSGAVIRDPTPTTRLYIGVSPDDRVYGYSANTDASISTNIPAVGVEGIGVPVGDGRMYGTFAGAGDVLPLNMTWGAYLRLIPRWLLLRGTEAV